MSSEKDKHSDLKSQKDTSLHQKPSFKQQLEPRFMFDGVGLEAFDPNSVEPLESDTDTLESLAEDAIAAETEQFFYPDMSVTEDTQSLVIVDTSVDNYQELLSELDVDESTPILYLDSQEEGMQQIERFLNDRSGDNFNSVHIISHGDAGELQLGTQSLNIDTLDENQGALNALKGALDSDADIMIYGCNVAEGEEGEHFVQVLGDYLDVDVAASSDLTGAEEQAADWDLEFNYGTVETEALYADEWSGVLRTIYVDNTPGDGTWETDHVGDFYEELDDALDNAVSNDEIWIAEGVYKPGNSRGDSFDLPSDVEIYGGFAGTESSLGERDWAHHPTILSGDIGVEGDASDNTYHVVTVGNGITGAYLNGVTIANGYADGSGSNTYGGGLFANVNDGYSVTPQILLDYVIFKDNYAERYGGAMSVYQETFIKIDNSFFVNNSAGDDSGAIDIWSPNSSNAAKVEISNSVFYNNTSNQYGGAIANWDSELEIDNSTFFNDTSGSDNRGDAIYQSDNSSSTEIANSIFWGSDNQIRQVSGTITVEYSDVQDGYSGTGNIDSDPLFRIAGPDGVYGTGDDLDLEGADGLYGTYDDNLVLTSGSAAIDSAHDGSATGTDILGYQHQDSAAESGLSDADMGAYEYNVSPVLGVGNYTLISILEDAVDPAGETIGDLIPSGVITDVDLPSSEGLESVAITEVDNTHGVWQYSLDGGASWNSFTSTTGSVVDISATAMLLDSTAEVRFIPNADWNGDSTFTFYSWDMMNNKNSGETEDLSSYSFVGNGPFSQISQQATITVTPVDDAPISVVNNALTVSEEGSGTLTNSYLSTSDIDTVAGNLTYTVTGSVSNGTLFHDGVALNIGDTFTQADIDSGKISYTHNGNETTSDSFNFTVQDATTTLSEATFNITVTSVDDAPVISGPSISVNEGQTVGVSISDLGISDVDTALGNVTVSVTSTNGQFLSNGSSTTTFTLADVDGGNVMFQHDGSETAPTFTVTAADAESSIGPVSGTVSFLANVDDAPIIGSPAISVNEGQTVGVSISDLGISDVDTALGDVTISVTSTNGQFLLNGSSTTSFTLADVDGGNVTFQHDGSEMAPTFTVTAADAESSVGPVSGTVSFLANVDDAPQQGSVSEFALIQGETEIFDPIHFNVTDPDTSSENIVYTLASVPSHGVLTNTNTGQTLGMGDTFTHADVESGDLKYIHNGNHVGEDGFRFTVGDETTTLPESTFNIMLHPREHDDTVPEESSEDVSQSDRLKEVEREEEEVLKKELLLDYDPLNVDYNTDIDPTQLVSLGDRSDKSVYQLMDEDAEQETQDVEKGEEDLEKDGKKGKKTGQNRSKPRSLKEKEPSNEQ